MYITVGNSSSLNYFPQNTHTVFSNHLPVAIPTDRPLEVGLVSLLYKPNKLAKKSSIFTNPEDKIIISTQYFKFLHTITKTENVRLETFIQGVTAQLRERHTNVEITYTTKEDGKTYIVLTNNQVDRETKNPYFVQMTESYAKAFGLLETTYGNGVHRGERELSRELFNLIEPTEKLDILLTSTKVEKIIVKEPEIKTVIDLISSINEALEEKGIAFTYNFKELEYVNENNLNSTELKLSAFLNNLFGLPEDAVFKGNDMKYPAYNEIDLSLSSELILVKSDIAKPQYYNGHMYPVLKVLKQEFSDSYVQVNCNPIIYVPCKDEHIQNIKIELQDEQFSELDLFPESFTQVTLHIKNQY